MSSSPPYLWLVEHGAREREHVRLRLLDDRAEPALESVAGIAGKVEYDHDGAKDREWGADWQGSAPAHAPAQAPAQARPAGRGAGAHDCGPLLTVALY